MGSCGHDWPHLVSTFLCTLTHSCSLIWYLRSTLIIWHIRTINQTLFPGTLFWSKYSTLFKHNCCQQLKICLPLFLLFSPWCWHVVEMKGSHVSVSFMTPTFSPQLSLETSTPTDSLWSQDNVLYKGRRTRLLFHKLWHLGNQGFCTQSACCEIYFPHRCVIQRKSGSAGIFWNL